MAKFNPVIIDGLRPFGGPSGYLYNLQKSLEHNNTDDIKILCYGIEEHDPEQKKQQSGLIRNLRKSLKRLKLRVTPHTIRYRYVLEKQKNRYLDFLRRIEPELDHSRLLHFHATGHLYTYLHDFRNDAALNATICLTSHSPKPPYAEMYDKLLHDGYSKKLATRLSNHQHEVDLHAFRKADYIVFPCKEATESYSEILTEANKDSSCLRYVLTSSTEPRSSLTRNEFRRLFGINEITTVFAFVGRKSEAKGYNVFCEAAAMLADRKDILFVAAGNGPVPSPKYANFLDLGWRDDPGSIYRGCDYIVAPNRETYFDIGIIQALAFDKPLITTCTGGNRWFKDKGADIIFIDYSATELQKIMSVSKPVPCKNRAFYEEYFHIDHFAVNYLKLYNDIDNEVEHSID